MSDAGLVAVAVLVAVAALVGIAVPGPVVVVLVLVAVAVRRPVVVAAVLVVAVGWRSHGSLAALDAPLPHRVSGTAELVSDPESGRFATTVELRLDGRRYQAQVPRDDEWVLRPLLTGDHVVVSGAVRPFRGVPEGWRRSRHLAGRLAVSEVERGPPAAPWYRAANGVHRLLADGSESFGDDRRALYLGLVVGDDRAQGDVETFRFRATGLGHLLAVSGQNVAFLMAVARPLLERCGLRTRWIAGIAVLIVFVLVTRAEASVLRAAAMAAVGLAVAGSGRAASGIRILALSVIGLLLADPLLVSGLGFQLSVCATLGLVLGVRPLSARLRELRRPGRRPPPGWLVEAVACTIAAQVATAPLLLGFNGGIPSVATLANVAAVPVAGLVMMLGLTVGLVAGAVRAPLAAVLNRPTHVLVGWIDGVAAVGSRVPMPLLDPARLVLVVAAVAVVALRPRPSRWPWVVATLLVGLALAPVPVPAGAHRVAPGVVIEVGCGTTSVELGGGVTTLDALSSLQAAGVVRADVVVGDGVAADEVAEQLGAALHPPGASERPCTVTP